MPECFTILGSSGLIGRNLCASLSEAGHTVRSISRGDRLPCDDLGHVIYAIGVTGDFRQRPIETVEAHVCALARVLRDAEFDSLLYLSSTRVYGGIETAHEDDDLHIRSNDVDHLYDLSKLMGESLALNAGRSQVRVARLSHVINGEFSSPNFLDQLVRDMLNQCEIHLRTDLESTRDYIGLDDVLTILPQISLRGRAQIYNVASGKPLAIGDIVRVLRRHFDAPVHVDPAATSPRAPIIDIQRARNEFGFSPRPIPPLLDRLLGQLEARVCPT